MLRRPRLRPHLRATVVSPESVLVAGDGEPRLLTGAGVAAIVPLLDGTRDREQIVQALDGALSDERIQGALEALERRGYLVEHDARLDDSAAAWWSIAGFEPSVAADRLQGATVKVVALAAGDDALERALAGLGIGVDEGAELAVVLVDDYLDRRLVAINVDALREQRPWMIARSTGAVVWFGPCFSPRATGCWACLAERLRENSATDEVARAAGGAAAPPPPHAALSVTADVVAGLLAGEVARALLGRPLQRLTALDLVSLTATHHSLPHRPQCPACGDRDLLARPPAPLELAGAAPGHARGGGTRTLDPAETVRRHRHLISPLTGVVQGLERLPVDPAGAIHVYETGHIPGPVPGGIDGLRAHLRRGATGKGPGDADARASALGEAVERHCSLYRRERHTVRASYRELAPAAAHPAELVQLSERQRGGASFPEHAEIEWTVVQPVLGGPARYLPTAWCFLDYPAGAAERLCPADTNGCAVGNTVEEAILHGLLEVVERDAVALWWYNRLRRPEVALPEEPPVAPVVAAHRALGRTVWALDLTADLAIPTVAVLSRRDQDGAGVVFGFGAHLDPAVALTRALCEAGQMLAETGKPGATRGPRGDVLEAWLRDAMPVSEPWLEPADVGASPRVEAGGDVVTDLRRCAGLLIDAGLEPLVVDQSLPDIGLPAVKVAVPGLRHFWPRFGPGRLYDVPVALGLFDAPTPEEELNPTPMVW